MAGRDLLRLPVSLAAIPPLVRAASELRCFGGVWCAAGLLELATGGVLAARGEIEGVEAVAIVVVLGLSIGGAVGGLLLARRTGPEMLYAQVLDQAPLLPDDVPRERPPETVRRVLAPALLAVLVLAVAGPIAVAAVLLMAGEPREQLAAELPALAPAVGGGWTLACGLAGLRMAWYFERWERRRGRVALCPPLRAGLMRHVYGVAER